MMSDDDDELSAVTLYCNEGTSDKIYNIALERRGKRYVVNVAYGRRGGTLKQETKTPTPLDYMKASELFHKLMLEKVSKGYVPMSSDDADEGASDEPTWEHPKLGLFEYDGSAWTRTVKTPAFKAFRYEGSSTKCELTFEADDESERPSRQAVSVAERLLANQEALAAKVAAALWDDFTGVGPNSGMYWHGDLDAVAEGLEFEDTLKPPKKAADLPRLMQLTNIAIQKRKRGQDKPLAELSFAAAFEEEHGVGVLTDGKTILGIGYSADVSPFKKSKKDRR
jgi:predicted DNA-binding WGR domain protein